MSYRDTYDFWMTDDYFDEDTKKELAAIADDEAEMRTDSMNWITKKKNGERGPVGLIWCHRWPAS